MNHWERTESRHSNKKYSTRQIHHTSTESKKAAIRNPSNLYNGIWEKVWKSAKITSLLKEGKDSTDFGSYRSVALTIILCKTFKSVTNKRLVWYLEEKKNCL